MVWLLSKTDDRFTERAPSDDTFEVLSRRNRSIKEKLYNVLQSRIFKPAHTKKYLATSAVLHSEISHHAC